MSHTMTYRRFVICLHRCVAGYIRLYSRRLRPSRFFYVTSVSLMTCARFSVLPFFYVTSVSLMTCARLSVLPFFYVTSVSLMTCARLSVLPFFHVTSVSLMTYARLSVLHIFCVFRQECFKVMSHSNV